MKKTRKNIANLIEDEERSFYGLKNVDFFNIQIKGEKDGESAFKECRDITVSDSEMCLRYPFWHVKGLLVKNSTLSSTARAGLWYCSNVVLENMNCEGVKVLRESSNISIKNSNFSSDEIGWSCNSVLVDTCSIVGVYAFSHSKSLTFKRMHFEGKYSFQYVDKATFIDCDFDTKDAFWHSNNITCINCVIRGEYLAWYSKNLKLINCKIVGTQPLCYAKNLILKNCTFENCDLAFEYTSLKGTILGSVDSIKNPLKGKVFIDKMPLMIIDENDRSHNKFTINERTDNV